MSNADWLIEKLLLLIPLWLSLSVHEYGHAWAAWRLGDDTAAMLGRLTLNPFAHIDFVGTLLLPLLGVPFGWAKPVPVQPHRFHPGINMRTGMLLTALAGPIMNVALAFVALIVWAIVVRFHPLPDGAHEGVRSLLEMLVFLNVILASFNMLPIPPLDGSRVVDGIMPESLRPLWERFYRLGPIALIAVFLLPPLTGVNLLAGPLMAVSYVMGHLMAVLGG